ncbi:MAG: ATPase, T2SS/T4P/T4SS family, partial [Bacteroidota bacterium]
MEGNNQVQLKEKIGLDFAASLRTFLRQDPDIIMVGEIRDVDTAKMATRAALTGHLVLSTIHTNSAVGVISRLVEMGVSPFLIADTLNVAVAQRLIRVLCPHCKEPAELSADHQYFDELKSQGVVGHYKPVGCTACYNTGYRGRKAIYEVVPVDSQVTGMIKKDQIDQIENYMKEKKIKLLTDSAIELLERGETSLEEINPYINHD